MSRFLVVDPGDNDDARMPQAAILVEATDGEEPLLTLRPGVELAVPETFDAHTLLGVPVLDITAVTLDGRTWIPGHVVLVELIVGSGKRVDFEVRGANLPKDLSRARPNMVSFHVSRLVAVATDPSPTRRDPRDPGQ